MSTLISVIVPAYNEQANVARAYTAITEQFAAMPGYDYELIFCDNHSTDGTFAALETIAANDRKVRVLRYARNFGFNRSILTGYRHAKGDAAIQIDCDLEDPPSVFTEFLRLWREGHDVVVGIRAQRFEPKWLIAARRMFYKLLDRISETPHTVDAGDFRLVDHSILAQLREIDDAQPYVRGLISELARSQTGVSYTRNKREAGESKFPLRKLISLAMHGIFTHSVAPLRIASYLGLFIAVVTAALTGIYIIAWLFFGQAWPSGFATTTVLILFGISLNAIFLGIIGEYVGRIYTQLRKRPTVIIEKALNIDGR